MNRTIKLSFTVGPLFAASHAIADEESSSSAVQLTRTATVAQARAAMLLDCTRANTACASRAERTVLETVFAYPDLTADEWELAYDNAHLPCCLDALACRNVLRTLGASTEEQDLVTSTPCHQYNEDFGALAERLKETKRKQSATLRSRPQTTATGKQSD